MPMPASYCHSSAPPIPVQAGIGFRAEHYRDLLDTHPTIGWLEVHPENYFGDGGKPLHYLQQARETYPLSFHGVGLSLGSVDPLSNVHLSKLKDLIHRYEPALVSEHLSWGSFGGRYLNDLLPLPYTEEALVHIVSRIDQTQEYLGRQILIENVSSYLEYTNAAIPEEEFVSEAAKRSGCGILLDVNNVYVNAHNHNFDALTYLEAIPAERVQEIHLAGFTVNQVDDTEIIIDSHNQLVASDVWRLYRRAIECFGPRPTLIEWDTDLPALEVLLGEAAKADHILEQFRVAA